MTDIVEPGLEAYATAHTTAPPAHLQELATELEATLPAPGMMVGRLEGRFLELLTFALGARRVLEIGTFGGYSTIWLARGLPGDGSVLTLEIDAHHADVARNNIDAAGLSELVEVRLGPAAETLAGLTGTFDLVFIDADKAAYPDYFEAVLPKLAPGGLIAADNTLWSGQVLDPDDQSVDTVALRRFNDALVVDPRVVVVQTTVRDGVTLVRRAG